MKILVTGANGFIGKNLIAELKNRGYKEIYRVTRETDRSRLDSYTKSCEFIFHLAGVNRPKEDREFMEGNFGFTWELLESLRKHKNRSSLLMTSSIQVSSYNSYGNSKRAAEDLLFKYAREIGKEVYLYRLDNVFGKWSRPNYNSVVATFCHSISRDIDIRIDDREKVLSLCYIDDLVHEFINAMEGNPSREGKFCIVPKVYPIKLGQLAYIIRSFKESRENLFVANMEDELTKKLYSSYLSYLPKDKFAYQLKMNKDERGSFTEFLKFPSRGQISINVSKVGVTKGNHWHHSKNEKFLVVSGQGLIRFRKLGSKEIIEYKVSGEELQVVDIPGGYTHNISNIGDRDLVTIIWANEVFDPQTPDTYPLEV